MIFVLPDDEVLKEKFYNIGMSLFYFPHVKKSF
jgi:hypothetical protein